MLRLLIQYLPNFRRQLLYNAVPKLHSRRMYRVLSSKTLTNRQ